MIDFTDEQLKFFANYIERQMGIQYSEANLFQLRYRLNEIALQLGIQEGSAFMLKARAGIEGDFRDLLLDTATNNETSFFRDPHVFKALAENVIPEILARGEREIRVWSAASSTGQEAYSIAMAIEEAMKKGLYNIPYSILLSDFSDRVLKRAQSGLYSQLEVQRGLPAKNLVTYFKKTPDNSWQVSSELGRKFTFQRINLIESWPPLNPFHVIFCRNVLIYQSLANKVAVVKKFENLVRPGGYLVLGAAESLLGISERFKQVSHQGAMFFQAP